MEQIVPQPHHDFTKINGRYLEDIHCTDTSIHNGKTLQQYLDEKYKITRAKKADQANTK
jgi:hypothetical protein